MFRRRIKPSIGYWLRDLFWPAAGWRRRTRYVFLRLVRLSGSPYSVAAGFACGGAVSFTPFLGFHVVLGVALSWMLGANPIAAVVGTLIGNPWTLPFIWWWTYWLGHHLLPRHELIVLSQGLSLSYLTRHAWDILAPMALGGVLSAVVAWFALYYPTRRLIVAYRRNMPQGRNFTRRRED